LVGTSEAFQAILRRIHEASQGRSTVLITGETGTGKGMIARAIHAQSREQDQPFQVIDCATVPEGMVESELFGHVRGAFTGAVSDKPGLIELADGGSVFLDEIGELPLALQTKLLRVLEDNEVRPVGGTHVKRVDMRFIAATNQDLEAKVRDGSFRKDLYYRLAVLTITVPPLRERAEDIPVIARRLMAQLGREMGKPGRSLDPSAMEALAGYWWPGNVRELRNVLERTLMLTTDAAVRGANIKALLPQGQAATAAPGEFLSYLGGSYSDVKQRLLKEFTVAYLKNKLAVHDEHISQAALHSGMPRQNFSRLMKRYLGRSE
jgi:transcriptional regulator with PAS, ATPase and Fis domain